LLEQALEEDIRTGDLTTSLLVPTDLRAEAYMLIKDQGVLAGTEVFTEVFRVLNGEVESDILIPDGSHVDEGDVAVRLRGRASTLLTGERTALNFVQQMSGIATRTAQYVAAAGPELRVNHIRKVTPLLRALHVYAVRAGGGSYNRFGLDDGILIKDNHLVVARRLGLTLKEVVDRCRQGAPITVKIGLEVESLGDLQEAIDAAPDMLVLDNMTPEEIRTGVEMVAGRIPVDVTGRVNLETLPRIAETGADVVGVGAITHSTPWLDISLELEFAN
jgi:nicotinate-nucleotide pyrophosphorylase (carboxylating)